MPEFDNTPSNISEEDFRIACKKPMAKVVGMVSRMRMLQEKYESAPECSCNSGSVEYCGTCKLGQTIVELSQIMNEALKSGESSDDTGKV